MTGRRLYDQFVDSVRHADLTGYWANSTELPGEATRPNVWAYLSKHDKAVWNGLAARITPKPKARA